MKIRRAALLFASLAVLAPPPAFAARLPYLYQKLNLPAYKGAYEALFRGEKGLPPWLQAFLASLDGVEMPGQAVGQGRYELYPVCQPHNCAGNFLYALFPKGGGKAWALLTKDGKVVRFFGRPGKEERVLLLAAAKK